ncbi:MAG: GNAT family N-acetyltransferase [Gammaproteobacteria bacterium]|nr:GNAT family N-acetyltransferase [Gammaproteobacteria bacterium]MDH5617629.1 GNAT family N-acetyltransferase [Gammaproteobacteria bacterium]
MKVTVHESISGIARDDWNALAGDAYPFLSHAFLELAETTGSVSPDAGWAPRHLTLEDGGVLLGALPLYEKSHSWGEFVFDWAWAQAYEQAGFDYYPKLVSAVPFTPAPSSRILLADKGDTQAARTLITAATGLAAETGCSSVHFLFPAEEETSLFEESGLLLRKDCQFHWHNRGYRDFDAFISTFTSAKRKKARRDRRRVQESGITFRRLRGAELDADTWSTVYALIARTFMMRGSLPYFNQAFFEGLSDQLPDGVLVILAEQDELPVAAAVFFESETTLYGRYWGSDGHFDALHFETCYYQGIEYCIETGKQHFEPGTQGEHKISRGFSPVTTWSAHWLAHPEFANAIGRYLDEEGRHIQRYIDAIARHTPYRDEE